MRPQINKQKEQVAFTTNLTKGEEVVTSSGMIGRINRIDTNEIMLELDAKTFVRIVPSAISKEMTDQYRKATAS